MSNEEALQPAHIRFLSNAVDLKRVLWGVIVGAPLTVAGYYASQRATDAVTAHLLSEITRRLDVQRDATKDRFNEHQARIDREIDSLRADIRELRQRVDRANDTRGTR